MAVNFKYVVTEIPPKEGLVMVPTERLQTGIALPFNVYIKDNTVIKKIFNKGNILNSLFLEILKDKGINNVYIDKGEIKSLELYLTQKKPKRKIQDIKIAYSNYSFFKEKHHQIDRKLILPNSKVNFSIYNLKGFELKKIVNATIDNPVTIESNLLELDGDFLIEDKDIPLYEEYIKNLAEFLKKENLSEEDKRILNNLLLKENSKTLMKELLKEPRSGEKIKKVNEMVDNIINQIIEEPESIYSLLTLKGYDYYTYTHSINVGVLAIGLGIQIKMDKDSIYKLGVGAILHDLGKADIPHEILNKQGKLTDTEYQIIKQHVIRGYNILENNKDIPKESFVALLQHHEKLTGRGYPFGLKGDEIKLFGRITAIVDCYDALTTRRPYKAPLTPFFSLSLISKEKENYDRELLKEFVKMLGNVR